MDRYGWNDRSKFTFKILFHWCISVRDDRMTCGEDKPRALASLTAWRISSTSSSVRRTGSGWCGEGGAWRESRGSRDSRGVVSRGNESRFSRVSPVSRRSRSASTCFSCSASDAAGPTSQQPLLATLHSRLVPPLPLAS